MIAVRSMLDVRGPFSAMVWAFMCVAWQGGRRSGELVRAKARTGAWNPKFDMHRGRLSWDWNTEAGVWRRVRIELGPDKTDPSGEQGHTVYLPFDDNAEINAAAAQVSVRQRLHHLRGNRREPEQPFVEVEAVEVWEQRRRRRR